MYNEGTIIYFKPFFFRNGKSKPKFFVVLKNVNNSYLLASLPTKEDHIPENELLDRGCIDSTSSSINCFRIPSSEIVTKCGKQFKMTTHLYGEEIIKESIVSLEEKYKVEGINYDIWGQMKDDLFAELIDCFKNSDVPKRRFIRDLKS